MMDTNHELRVLGEKIQQRVDRDGYYKISLGPEKRLLEGLTPGEIHDFAQSIHCSVVRRMGGGIHEFTHDSHHPGPHG